ncbi:MAG: pyrimidine dimer DNA glycosylase/endonuclease V [Armatimonadota bacterium]
MRLWSIHPGYLSGQRLTALWREALLAQKVLQGKTKGYKNHPQLLRFKAHPYPLKAISAYLIYVHEEAEKRGYNFDKSKIKDTPSKRKIPVTDGQLKYEFKHLCIKLKKCIPARIKTVKQHSFFKVIKGGIEKWEKIKS